MPPGCSLAPKEKVSQEPGILDVKDPEVESVSV